MTDELEIYSAVRDKAVVMFQYRDRVKQTVEAHGLEIRSDGRRLLIGFQVDGEGTSKTSIGWRAFDINNISRFRRTHDHFTDARRAPTTTEAGRLISGYLKDGVPSEEIVDKLVDLGTPKAWVEEYLLQKQGRIIALDASRGSARFAGDSTPVCSFCGRTVVQARELLSSGKAYICPDCVNKCKDIIDDDA